MLDDPETGLKTDRQFLLALEIRIGEHCPAGQLDEQIVMIRQGTSREYQHCEFVTKSSSTEEEIRVHHFTKPVERDCFCLTFAEFGCVPHITKVTNSTMVIETFIQNKEQAWELLTTLEETTDGVELRRLNSSNFTEDVNASGEVDLSVLTPKQRQALEVAVESGYFETPRKTRLQDLAVEFDISTSAFGQRLRSAQRKLMEQLL